MSHYVIATGGREYDSYTDVLEVISFLQMFHASELRVLHGGARGADALVQRACDELDVKVKAYPADWSGDGRSAGPKRNARMVGLVTEWRQLGHSCSGLAFRGGAGTKDCYQRMEKADIVVSYIPEEWPFKRVERVVETQPL